MIHIPQRSVLSPQFKYHIHIHSTYRFLKWKREAFKDAAEGSEVFLRLFNRVKTDLVSQVIRMTECTADVLMLISQVSIGACSNFAASLIEHHDRCHLSEPEMTYLSGLM
jgi:hypothetical protein